jgi:pyruvate dehydrogenase E2 component (dihydrolipoamide acetyltransferase)
VGAVTEIRVPDIGDFKDVPIIEVLVAPGDVIKAEDSLIALESEKATMEVPSPQAGIVRELKAKVGDKVSEGSPILTLEVSEEPKPAEARSEPAKKELESRAEPAKKELESRAEPARKELESRPERKVEEPARVGQVPRKPPPLAPVAETRFSQAHAGPSVRRLAREFGVDLSKVEGSGPKGRILKEDVQSYVKSTLSAPVGFAAPTVPEIDFSKFGTIEEKPLSRIRKLAGSNLHRNWLAIPHVTQHDEADITGLEEFRQSMAREQGVKLTLLSFLIKAAQAGLKEFPEFNSSLNASGDALTLKRYFHIGFAVDTDEGLVVPVIRDVDRKGVLQIAKEIAEMSERARAKKLTPSEMQGGCFSISSLGGIGGTHFTPIINAPEVAILGVSRSYQKPVFENGSWMPRLMLPLSLSYDHRVIDGAQAARFTRYLSGVLADVRRLLL